MLQTKLSPITNRNLFSSYFIEERLPKRIKEWSDEKIISIFEEIKNLYYGERELLPNYNEFQLEEHFIKPVLSHLGHCVEVQQPDRRGKKPDYALRMRKKEEKQH